MRYVIVYWFYWVGFLWYGLTRRFDRGGHPIPVPESPSDLVDRLGGGGRYRADRADTMRAPTVVQARIDRGLPIGDCDDHAGYIAHGLCLLHPDGSPGLVQVHGMVDGKAAGHVACVWPGLGGGWYCADYAVRGPFPDTIAAIEEIARGVGMAPRVAAWVPVRLHRGRLRHLWRYRGRTRWPA